MTHLVLLDVDGVVCPDPGAAKRAGGFDDWRRPMRRPRLAPGAGRAHARTSRQMGARLAALPAELAWLTSWEDQANRCLVSELGLPPLPTVAWTHLCGPRLDHRDKAAALAGWLADRPDYDRVVWVDDELAAGRALDFTRPGHPNPLAGRDHLLVATDPAVGLTVAQLDRIAAWLP